jgi:hypothetical protein
MRRWLSVLVLLSSIIVPFAAAPSAHANPSVEATRVLVTNQDGGTGCAYNQHVLIADPFGGGVASGGDLGVAPGVSGVINEAKPLNRSNQIIAAWGANGTGQPGGVGIYDRSSAAWTTHFAFPSTWENALNGNTVHSVDQLPDGNIVVATVGNIGTGTPEGNLVVLDPSGSVLSSLPLPSAHGVTWDASRNVLFAIGYTTLVEVSYDPAHSPMLQLARPAWDLKTPIGHDIQRRRVDNQFYISTNSEMYIFDPDNATTPFTRMVKGDGTGYGSVKSIDARFDGLATYAMWKTNVFQFVNSTSVNASFCSGTFYKVRWLYDQGQPLYREDDVTPGYNQANFVASTKLDKPANQQTPMAKSQWVGASAWSDKAGVAKELTTEIANGQIPYVFLYQWANQIKTWSGVTQTQINDWVAWASSLASVLGSHEAYVVIEPEWDLSITNACSASYSAALGRVIAEFRRHAVNTHLVNGMGFWNLNPGTAYDCFKENAKLFDLQGVSLHLVSNYSNCTWRTANFGGPYTDGRTLSSLTDPNSSSYVVKIAKTKVTSVHKIFGTPNVLIDDMAVTRCDPNNPSVSFGNSGQTQLINIMGSAFPDLYDNYGVRGYMLRTGGPPESARAMGDNNEGYFDYPNNPPAVTEVNNTVANMETHVTAVSGGSTGTPAFTASADAPSSVNPGAPATITTTITDTGGALSNGQVTIDVLNSGGGNAGTHTFAGQTFANSETKVLSWTWTAAQTPGTYSVRVTVAGNGGTPSYYSQTLASIAVASSGPSFAASEVASPRTIGPGDTTTVNVSVTDTGGAMSLGDVTINTYDPSGAVFATSTQSAQTFAAGEVKTYSIPVATTSSAPLGTYTVRVAVAAAGGSPTYAVDDDAGTFDVATNQFTSATTVSQASVAPGAGSATISATFTNNGAAVSNLITDIEVYDPTNTRAYQASWSGQSFTAGGQLTFTTTWSPPAGAPAGAYVVRVGVFTANWASTLHWNNQAASTGVAAPVWSSSATASPQSVAPSGASTITTYVTNNGGSYDNANIDVEVWNAAGTTQVGHLTWSGQTMGAGQTRAYTYNWTAPATTGTYTVKVGVMAPSWTPTLSWNNNAGSVTVAAPTFTGSATVSASSVLPSQSANITATFTATGGSLVNGKTDIEVYDSAGNRLASPAGQQFWTDSLSDGQSVTHTWTWPGTVNPGTYTVKIGVFSGTWGSTYLWNNNAATISVGGTFQPSFTIGSGANNWWVEVYTSSDVTSVDAIGRDGQFYLPLVKRSWGAWAATAPSALANGDLVQFVAHRSSDSSSAASSDFGWLTQTPTTSPGWASTFTVGTGASTTWVEVYVSASATAVDVKVGSGAWTALTHQTYGAWAKAMNVAAGSKVLFRATRSDSAKAYSSVYNWLQ